MSANNTNPNPAPSNSNLSAQPIGGAMRVEVNSNPTQNPPAPAPAPERPGWLPEKFKSPEELATAYAQLEKKLGGQAPAPAAAGGNTDPNAQVQPDPNAASTLVGRKDFEAYSAEFAEHGKLSDESFAALEKRGFSRELVEDYIAGQAARNEVQVQAVYQEVGGEQAYQGMLEWAEENLQQGDIDAFNGVVSRGSQAEILMAVRGLKAQYAASNKEPRLVTATAPTSGSGEAPFQSTAEMVAAMSDKRYKTDSAYRDMVERRLAKSDILG